MLAPLRRGAAHVARGVRQLERNAELFDLAVPGVLDLDDHLPMRDLRISHDLLDVVDLADADVGRGEQFVPLVAISRPDDGLDLPTRGFLLGVR